MEKTIALFSGGKDGMYALVKTRISDIDLIVTITSEEGANQLHAGPEINKELRDAQLKLIGLPAQKLVVGHGNNYLNEVFNGLKDIVQKEGITRLVTGDLWHPYTTGIGDMLAGALGVEILRPSRIDCPSNESSRGYMGKVFQSGIESVVIGVRKGDLPKEFVGRKVDETFLNEMVGYSNDFAGEGGQYQTLVTSAPIMHGKIVISSFDVELVQGKNGKESFYRMNTIDFSINQNGK